MSHNNGDTQDLARHLAVACNEYAQAHGKVIAADAGTAETVSGHVFTVFYDGREYSVLVALSSASVMADEFREYGS